MSGKWGDGMLSMNLDMDGGAGDGGGGDLEQVSAQSQQEAAAEVVKGIDPPCPKANETAAAYQLRATNYCIGVVQNAVPGFSKQLAATACTSMNPKIAEAFNGIGQCKG